MKILEVLCGGKWGGGGVVVRSFVKELIERGDEVWVMALDDEVAERFAEVGARIIRSPFWFRPINPLDIIPFVQIWALCLRHRFDLVATHTSKGGFIGRVAARLAGIPYIIHHAHGFAFREAQRPWIQRLYMVLERIAAGACDCILSVSEEHRQAAIEEGVAPAGKIRTILNGIDLAPFENATRESARRKLGFGDAEMLIGAANRLVPGKGVQHLVAAAPVILAAYPAAHIVLFGDGPMEAGLREEAANSGFGDRIHFKGFRQDVPELLAAFDVLVQPSLSEGLSISVLESMAAGKALVVCDIRGNRELIEHRRNGWMVPMAQPSVLADAVCTLLGNPALAEQLGREAQRDCRARFTQNRMIEQTLAAYDGRAVTLPGLQESTL